MKRIVKLAAALILLGILSAACNHYTCPAYSKAPAKKQPVETTRS